MFCNIAGKMFVLKRLRKKKRRMEQQELDNNTYGSILVLEHLNIASRLLPNTSAQLCKWKMFSNILFLNNHFILELLSITLHYYVFKLVSNVNKSFITSQKSFSLSKCNVPGGSHQNKCLLKISQYCITKFL